MRTCFLTAFFISFLYSPATAQKSFIALKKGVHVKKRYWQDGLFAFELKNGQLMNGTITKITKDSIDIKPYAIDYHFMRADTLHLNTQHIALKDIKGVPVRGLNIDYYNGRYRVSRGDGHMHFYWLKSGLLLRIAAIGYVALKLTNSALNRLSLKDQAGDMAVAAAVYGTGLFMKKKYSVFTKITNRRKLVAVCL